MLGNRSEKLKDISVGIRKGKLPAPRLGIVTLLDAYRTEALGILFSRRQKITSAVATAASIPLLYSSFAHLSASCSTFNTGSIGRSSHVVHTTVASLQEDRNRGRMGHSSELRATARGFGSCPPGSPRPPPWYLGCQFHPEYKSKPTDPHPLFISYIRAALDYRATRGELVQGESTVSDAIEVGLASKEPS